MLSLRRPRSLGPQMENRNVDGRKQNVQIFNVSSIASGLENRITAQAHGYYRYYCPLSDVYIISFTCVHYECNSLLTPNLFRCSHRERLLFVLIIHYITEIP